jgi:hypothetical protein
VRYVVGGTALAAVNALTACLARLLVAVEVEERAGAGEGSGGGAGEGTRGKKPRQSICRTRVVLAHCCSVFFF